MSELFRREFLRSRGEILLSGVTINSTQSSAWIAGVAFTLAMLLLLGSYFGTYARKESAPGFLVPSAGLAYVYAPRAGVVERVLARDGDHVKAGDQLIDVRSSRTTSESLDVDARQGELLKQERDALGRQIVQETTLSESTQKLLSARVDNLRRQQSDLRKQLDNAGKRVGLRDKELERVSSLGEYAAQSTKDIYIGELLRAQQEVSALQGQSERLASEIQAAVAELEQSPARLELRLSQLRMEQAEADREIAESEHRRGYIVRSPITGRVTALIGHVGMATQTDQPLLTIIPDGTELQAELLVPTRAIGFVRENQKVLLRYDAFPYQKFGLYPGVVKSISRAVLSQSQQTGPVRSDSPAYRVLVSIEAQSVDAYGMKVLLQPGLTLQADIIRDRRRILEWVLDPIFAAGRSL